VVLVVNKMDLVGWDAGAFRAVEEQFRDAVAPLGIADVVAVPVSALHGDNVVRRSRRATWYPGPTLLEHLEEVDPAGPVAPREAPGLRFPVQYVVRAPERD
jgi:sulfate adenylyltransferase subunit 1 (EFTu-like GTPase family)